MVHSTPDLRVHGELIFLAHVGELLYFGGGYLVRFLLQTHEIHRFSLHFEELFHHLLLLLFLALVEEAHVVRQIDFQFRLSYFKLLLLFFYVRFCPLDYLDLRLLDDEIEGFEFLAVDDFRFLLSLFDSEPVGVHAIGLEFEFGEVVSLNNEKVLLCGGG